MNHVCFRAAFLAALLLAAGPALSAGSLTPPKIIQTVEPRFPATLEQTAIPDGEVGVLISLDAGGSLADVLVTDYTHKDFAREAVAVLRQWRFEPARLDGRAVGTRMAIKFNFSTTTRVVSLTPLDTMSMLLRQTGMRPGHNLVCPPRELDRPMTVLHAATPLHPGPALNIPTGRTLMDFYVDETGRARLPVILQTTHPAFANAALRALADWQFAVPTRHGQPVIVRLQQEFVFVAGS